MFVAPRVIKEMGLTQRIKILFSRASFTAFGLMAASILSQGNSNWIAYWVVFAVLSYLSMFVPFANKMAMQIGWVKYTAMLDGFVAAKAPTYDPFEEPSPLDRHVYDPAYSGMSGNIFTKHR